MSEEDFALIPLTETAKKYVKSVETNDLEFIENVRNQDNRRIKNRSLFLRVPSFRLRPNLSKLRSNLQKINCFKGEKDEEIVMEVQRHKSIDIGVGFARKMSLFLFTRRSVCVHPYHPFTPQQTTRKIYLFNEEKHH